MDFEELKNWEKVGAKNVDDPSNKILKNIEYGINIYQKT